MLGRIGRTETWTDQSQPFLLCAPRRPPSLHRRELCLRADQNHLVDFAAHVRLWAGGRILPHHQLHHHDSHPSQPRHQIQEEATVKENADAEQLSILIVWRGAPPRWDLNLGKLTVDALCLNVPTVRLSALSFLTWMNFWKCVSRGNYTDCITLEWNMDADIHNVNSLNAEMDSNTVPWWGISESCINSIIPWAPRKCLEEDFYGASLDFKYIH